MMRRRARHWARNPAPGVYVRKRLTNWQSLHFEETIMRHVWFYFMTIPLMMGLALLNADTVRLRDGKTLDGKFVGASAQQVDFLTASGETIKFSIDNVRSVSFSPPPPPPPAPKPPETTPARKPVLIPSGTSFRVRTIDSIDVDAT